MNNILENHELLSGDDLFAYETISKDGIEHWVYNVAQWNPTHVLATAPGSLKESETDNQLIPTIYPKEAADGKKRLTVEAAFKTFVMRLEKSLVNVRAHQRYLAKMVLDLSQLQLTSGDTGTIRWRLLIRTHDAVSGQLTHIVKDWQSDPLWDSEVTLLGVVHSYSAQIVSIAVEIWSVFGNIDGRFIIKSIELLEVESSYGGNDFFPLGQAVTPPPVFTPPTPEPTPSPTPSPLPTGDIFLPNGQINWRKAVNLTAKLGIKALTVVAALTE